MGEAVYSIIAEFPEPVSDAKAKALKEFFLEGARAEDYWQEHRDLSKKDFWLEFRRQFPTVSEYLASIGRLGEDCNNGLSGQLNFGSVDDIEYQLSISENELSYAAEVWHFASWGPSPNS